MTSLTLRRAAGFAIACALGFACSGNKPPVPNGFVQAFVGPGNANSSVCGYASQQPIVAIGGADTAEPGTESNGDFAGTGTALIDCSVDSSGGGNFNVKISAEVNGSMGGSIVIVGTVNANGGSNISGAFESGTIGMFTESDCTVTFTYNMQPIPISGSPIASGRIWGHLSCPNAVDNGTTEIGADGGPTERTCDGEADFLFQNCN